MAQDIPIRGEMIRLGQLLKLAGMSSSGIRGVRCPNVAPLEPC